MASAQIIPYSSSAILNDVLSIGQHSQTPMATANGLSLSCRNIVIRGAL